MQVPDPLLTLARAVQTAGGRLFVVGGAVRDALAGLPAQDLDLEAHGLEEKDLRAVLQSLGSARRVGRSYPVYKLVLPGLGEVDVAMPREDDQLEDPVAASARHRDLTVNAMLYDPLRDQTLDPWGGQQDLKRRRLSAVDPETFGADPLRALRVAVFAARLTATPTPELVAQCRSMDLTTQPPERIGLELRKLWLRAPAPQVGLAWIQRLGLGDSVLPGVDLGPATQAAWQRAAAWRHSLEEHGPGPMLTLAWAVLLAHHPNPSEVLERADVHTMARWPVRQQVLALLAERPEVPRDDTGLRQLAERHPLWLVLRQAAAWNPTGPALDQLARSTELGVNKEPLPPLLQGRDLIALGVAPGPTLGAQLAALRQAQLFGQVASRTEARTWVRGRIGCAVEAPSALDEPKG